ncbi:MAG: phage terminase small subunit P27 family [Rickettsiales bacterium]|nr:phage terminase small subunit P27 family [Rickettsiales bacterium]
MAGVKGRSGGHNKKPLALRVLEGNPGKRRLPKELVPDEKLQHVSAPKPPNSLNKQAKNEWRRLAPQLYALGLLQELDYTALEMYCETFVVWRHALNEMDRIGIIVMHPVTGSPMVNPYYTVAQKCQRDMLQILREFGMTPVSRTRIAENMQPPPKTNKPSVWDDLIP